MSIKLFAALGFLGLVSLNSAPAFAGHAKPFHSDPPAISAQVLCYDASPDKDLKNKREDYCRLTNSLREWHFSSSLKLDAGLNEMAQKQAQEVYGMERIDNSENFFDTAYNFILGRMRNAGQQVGLVYNVFAVQVWEGGNAANEVIQKSLGQAAPRKKFYDRAFRKIGIGVYKGIWISLFTD